MRTACVQVATVNAHLQSPYAYAFDVGLASCLLINHLAKNNVKKLLSRRRKMSHNVTLMSQRTASLSWREWFLKSLPPLPPEQKL